MQWQTRELVFVVILSLVVGLLYLGWSFVWNLAAPLQALGLQDLFVGFWYIAGPLSGYILRRRGSAFVSETLAASTEVLTGGPFGLVSLMMGAVQGLASEAVFFATRYRRYSLGVLLCAGVLPALPNFLIVYVLYFRDVAPVLLAVKFVARMISGAFLAGWAAKLIGDRLLAAGVVDNYAIARDRINRKP